MESGLCFPNQARSSVRVTSCVNRSQSGKREACHLRKIRRELIEDLSRIQIREQSDSAADHGLLTRGAPRKSHAWLEDDSFHVGQNLTDSCRHHLIKGNRRGMAEVGKRHRAARNATRLACATGVPVSPQRQGKLQFRIHFEFVLEIKAYAIEGQRLRIMNRAVLLNDVGRSVCEIQHTGLNRGEASFACGEVADIIAAEVYAHLEGVFSAFDRKVIHKLPLGPVASLGKQREKWIRTRS